MKPSQIIVPILVACAILGNLQVYTSGVAHASPGTEIRVVNPLTGDNLFNFTPSTKSVGDDFIVNITVADVIDLATWQVKLTWDSTILSYVNITRPADNVFAGRSYIAPSPIVSAGSVKWGCILFPSDQPTFNGSGRLCQIGLKITQGVNRQSPLVSCSLTLANPTIDTFLLDSQSHDIPFTAVNGAYQYSWTPPSYNPTIYVKPPTMQPMHLGDVFALEIWMKDVSPDWSITGVQFSLMWNTTFIVPALGPNGTYYDEGAFFETFEYYPGGIVYAAEINAHDRPPPSTPLPDDYNYSLFGIVLLSDNPPNPPYHPPYLSGEGRVMTVYFQAVLETVFPMEAYTWIDFISEDTYVVDIFSMNVLVYSVGCLYRAPVTLIILEHDLAVTDVTVSKSIIGQGYFARVNVTLVNEGDFAEYFNVTVYANGSQIARQENIALENGISATLPLSWNTTGFGLGNFTLWAYAEPVSGETNTDDNNFTLPALVGVTFAGDVTGASGTPDWKVDMRDIGVICGKFGKSPVSPGWDPNIDIDGDDIVNMRDIGIACNNFGKHYP